MVLLVAFACSGRQQQITNQEKVQLIYPISDSLAIAMPDMIRDGLPSMTPMWEDRSKQERPTPDAGLVLEGECPTYE